MLESVLDVSSELISVEILFQPCNLFRRFCHGVMGRCDRCRQASTCFYYYIRSVSCLPLTHFYSVLYDSENENTSPLGCALG